MRISDLREFARLAQTLSFTQTAREFYLSQSVLSRHIARMEEELGVKLLTRTHHGVLLTNAGALFLSDAKKAVSNYDRALRSLEALKHGAKNTLHIGYLYGASKPHLPAVINQMKHAHPELGIHLTSLELGDVSHMLSNDRIDVAVTTANPALAFPKDSYLVQELYDDPFVAILPRGHALARNEVLSVADIKDTYIVIQPLNMGTDDSDEARHLLQQFKDGSYLQKTQYDVASVHTLLCTGSCIAITSKHLTNIFGSEFVSRPLQEARDIPFKVLVVWKKDKDGPLVREFSKRMHDHVRHSANA